RRPVRGTNEGAGSRPRRRPRAQVSPPARRPRPPPADKSLTVGKIIRWWLDEYVAGKTWAGREEDRFRLHFQSPDLVRLTVAALTTARLESFLQHWTHQDLAPASVNRLRAMVSTAWNRARKAGLV